MAQLLLRRRIVATARPVCHAISAPPGLAHTQQQRAHAEQRKRLFGVKESADETISQQQSSAKPTPPPAASTEEHRVRGSKQRRPTKPLILSAKTAPMLVTVFIRDATSVDQLQAVFDADVRLNSVHVAAMLGKLAQLATYLRRAETSPPPRFDRDLDPSVSAEEREAAIEAAAVAYADRHKSSIKTVQRLANRLVQLTQENLVELDAQGVVTILHSLGRLAQLDSKAEEQAKRHAQVPQPRLQHRLKKPAADWRLKLTTPQLLLPRPQEGSLATSVIDDLLYMSHQHLPDINPQGLSMLIYAVACLEVKPERPWMAAFFRRSLSLLSEFTPQGLANTIWALASIGLHPPSEWEREFYKQCQAKLQSFEIQALSITLWSLSTLELQPNTQLLDQFVKTIGRPQLESFSPQNMCHAVWGLARLGAVVPRPWLDQVVTVVRLPLYNNRELCTLLHSMAILGFVPLSSKDVRWCRALQARLRLATNGKLTPPRIISNTLHALGKLQLREEARDSQLLPCLISAARQRMGDFLPQSLANIVWALARLDARPDAKWMSAFAEQCGNKLDEFNAQELSNTVWAFAQLQYTPDVKWMARFDQASTALMPSYTPQNLSNTLWAFAALRYKPSVEWCTAFHRQLAAKQAQLTKGQVKELLASLPDTGMALPRALVSSLSSRLTEVVPSFASGKQLVEALLGAARLGVRPEQAWLRLTEDELCEHMHGMGLEALADVWWSFGVLGYEPGPAWLQAFVSALQAAVPGGSPSAASKLIISSARPAGPGAQRPRGLPGGPAMLQALLRLLLPAPVTTASAAQEPGWLAQPPGGPGSQPRSSVSAPQVLTGAPVRPVGVTPRAERAPQGGGLRGMDGSQMLLLMDAVVQLGFASPEAVMGMFVMAARGQTR